MLLDTKVPRMHIILLRPASDVEHHALNKKERE